MQIVSSDNNAGVHQDIMVALNEANKGRTNSYGQDPISEKARDLMKRVFGDKANTHFVFAGTAANILSFKSVLKPYEAVVCTSIAHIHTDECGAPENAGIKLFSIPKKSGKLEPQDIIPLLSLKNSYHHAQPKIVSITQATEKGQVYTPSEIQEIADFCKKNDLYLHMDGSRLTNASCSLGVKLAESSSNLGVDILSFGGTKNGLMFGEAVIFFNEKLGHDFGYYQKQNMQMYSKNRFIAAQFIALLENDLWKKLAGNSNAMTKRLAEKVRGCPNFKFIAEPKVNAIFASLPQKSIETLNKDFEFYIMDPTPNNSVTELSGPFPGPEVRLMTSFDTSEKDVDDLADAIIKACK